MTLFPALLYKILPLYVTIAMGFLSGKYLKINRETIATLMFYVITPVVIFTGVMHTKLDLNILLLPVITFLISTSLCFLFYYFSGFIWNDPLRNLAAFSAGTANTGYFGLPIAILLFSNQGEGIYIMALLGMTLYENSVGYYTLARGSYSVADCLKKLAKLPTLYAFLVALVLNSLQVPMLHFLSDFVQYFKGAYTVLGMLIIGLGVANLSRFSLDFKFIGVTFLARFVAWPLAIAGVISLDCFVFGFFDIQIYRALMLVAIVPLAANMVVLASLFNNHPEKAATAVLLSTLFALIFVPLMANWI